MSKNMENVAAISSNAWPRSTNWTGFGWDTVLVVFFLAMDLGRSFIGLGFDEIISFFTLASFVLFSYFLPVPAEKPGFGSWIASRLFVVIMGVISGIGIKVIPEDFLMNNVNLTPKVFLILAGILCAVSQMYGIIRVRLAG